jgi:hypothetical protein
MTGIEFDFSFLIPQSSVGAEHRTRVKSSMRFVPWSPRSIRSAAGVVRRRLVVHRARSRRLDASKTTKKGVGDIKRLYKHNRAVDKSDRTRKVIADCQAMGRMKESGTSDNQRCPESAVCGVEGSRMSAGVLGSEFGGSGTWAGCIDVPGVCA